MPSKVRIKNTEILKRALKTSILGPQTWGQGAARPPPPPGSAPDTP